MYMNTYYIIQIHFYTFICNSIKLKIKLQMKFILKKDTQQQNFVYFNIKLIYMVIVNL